MKTKRTLSNIFNLGPEAELQKHGPQATSHVEVTLHATPQEIDEFLGSGRSTLLDYDETCLTTSSTSQLGPGALGREQCSNVPKPQPLLTVMNGFSLCSYWGMP